MPVRIVVPAPFCATRAGAGDRAAKGHDVGAVEDERAIVDDVAGDRAAGAAIAELQGAGADRGAAAVAVVGGEDRGAGADLADGAAAGDAAGKGHGVGAVEGQRAIVDDVAGDRAAGAAVAELQRAGADRGAAAVAVVPVRISVPAPIFSSGCGRWSRDGAGLGRDPDRDIELRVMESSTIGLAMVTLGTYDTDRAERGQHAGAERAVVGELQRALLRMVPPV